MEETGQDEGQLYNIHQCQHPSHRGEKALCRYRASDGLEILGTVDNSWVVSYCAVQLILFLYHVNDKICISRIGVMK